MPQHTVFSLAIATVLATLAAGCAVTPDGQGLPDVNSGNEAHKDGNKDPKPTTFVSELFECKINGCIIENLCLSPGATPADFQRFSECAVDGCPGEGVIDCVAAGGTVIDTGPCARSNPEFNARTFGGPFPICP